MWIYSTKPRRWFRYSRMKLEWRGLAWIWSLESRWTDWALRPSRPIQSASDRCTSHIPVGDNYWYPAWQISYRTVFDSPQPPKYAVLNSASTSVSILQQQAHVSCLVYPTKHHCWKMICGLISMSLWLILDLAWRRKSWTCCSRGSRRFLVSRSEPKGEWDWWRSQDTYYLWRFRSGSVCLSKWVVLLHHKYSLLTPPEITELSKLYWTWCLRELTEQWEVGSK